MLEKAENFVDISFEDTERARSLFGPHNEHLKILERQAGVEITSKGNHLRVKGESHSVSVAAKVLEELYEILKRGYPLYSNDVIQAVKIAQTDRNVDLREIFLDTVFVSSRKKVITPKSFAQKVYIDSIRNYDIVFGIGPAGTGKTFLAMAMAISFLLKKMVKRIVLARPAVEAGEKLGFLPGDMYEKVNPYLRPLYDALYTMLEYDQASRLIERGTIEIAPLAFMRGRTLNDSFIILDEAQNTTSEQMKMFLTRIGFGSKAVITGDITQVDLPTGKVSGLIEVRKILEGVEGIRFCYFSEIDVVRHPLVQEIIKAYEKWERERG
ncbi:MAG: PhoH family protein [Deltaproteobacteria bacterium]|nr:MAG: PhoH family protein [Deltaproteobacteria bacterium]